MKTHVLILSLFSYVYALGFIKMIWSFINIMALLSSLCGCGGGGGP